MITTKTVTAKRVDIYETATGKYMGDVSRDSIGVFQWYPVFNSTPVFSSGHLHAVAKLIDSLNETKNDTPTATD